MEARHIEKCKLGLGNKSSDNNQIPKQDGVKHKYDSNKKNRKEELRGKNTVSNKKNLSKVNLKSIILCNILMQKCMKGCRGKNYIKDPPPLEVTQRR